MHPMIENDGKINELIDKLELLLKRQDEFSNEINALRTEINQLKRRLAKNTTYVA